MNGNISYSLIDCDDSMSVMIVSKIKLPSRNAMNATAIAFQSLGFLCADFIDLLSCCERLSIKKDNPSRLSTPAQVVPRVFERLPFSGTTNQRLAFEQTVLM